MATLSLVPSVEGRVSLADARRNVLLTHAVDKLVARAGAHSALLQALRITVVSSTASGGGVSKMPHSLLPLMGEPYRGSSPTSHFCRQRVRPCVGCHSLSQ